MARHLGRSVAELRTKLPIYADPDADAEYIEVGLAGCPLLGPDDLCTVDPVKPSQCATFPFWPELLDDPQHMRRVCEGVDHPRGELISLPRRRQLARGRGRI